MVQVQVETYIEAPIEIVFDAARDMRLHSQALEWTGERMVDGPDMLELGDEITFEGKHLTDRLRFVAPLGPLGWIAERLFLAAYMRRLLARKNEAFKQTVERQR